MAWLYEKAYAPYTVHTYISAIGYSHKLFSFPDPSRVFYIVEIMKGYRKIGSRLDTKFPITLSILHRLLEVAPAVFSSQYQVCLSSHVLSCLFRVCASWGDGFVRRASGITTPATH